MLQISIIPLKEKIIEKFNKLKNKIDQLHSFITKDNFINIKLKNYTFKTEEHKKLLKSIDIIIEELANIARYWKDLKMHLIILIGIQKNIKFNKGGTVEYDKRREQINFIHSYQKANLDSLYKQIININDDNFINENIDITYEILAFNTDLYKMLTNIYIATDKYLNDTLKKKIESLINYLKIEKDIDDREQFEYLL